MGAELRLESELDRSWKIHGEAHRQAVADRNHFVTETRDRLGPEMAAEVQRHFDVALGRLLADNLPDLDPAAERGFHQLLALERAVMEIEGRIESQAIFFDPYNQHGLLPTLGLSWWDDVVPLLPENPGFLPVNNVERFLAMVRKATQRLPSEEGGEEMALDFRQRRQDLIRFLERAIGLQESLWCDL